MQTESDAIIKEYPLTEEATPSLAICQIIGENITCKKQKTDSRSLESNEP